MMVFNVEIFQSTHWKIHFTRPSMVVSLEYSSEVVFLQCIGHAMLAAVLWERSQSVDLKSRAAITSWYMFIWKVCAYWKPARIIHQHCKMQDSKLCAIMLSTNKFLCFWNLCSSSMPSISSSHSCGDCLLQREELSMCAQRAAYVCINRYGTQTSPQASVESETIFEDNIDCDEENHVCWHS